MVPNAIADERRVISRCRYEDTGYQIFDSIDGKFGTVCHFKVGEPHDAHSANSGSFWVHRDKRPGMRLQEKLTTTHPPLRSRDDLEAEFRDADPMYQIMDSAILVEQWAVSVFDIGQASSESVSTDMVEQTRRMIQGR